MRGVRMRAGALACLFALTQTSFLPVQKVSALAQGTGSRSAWVGPSTLGTFVHRVVDGRASCLEASEAQAQSLKERDQLLPLTILTPDSDPSRLRPGLKI